MFSLPTLAGRFPFRLGTTSYIVPADMETNVRILADKVDDVELLFFESHELSPLPGRETIRALRSIAWFENLSYTVHLPLDCWLGHPEKRERERSANRCRRVIDRTGPLDPLAYILHLRGDRDGPEPVDDVPGWQTRIVATLEETVLKAVDPSLVCIETLGYPFEWVTPVAESLGLSFCLDVGHILMGGYPLDEYLDRFLARARVIHLHGVRNNRDHNAVSCLPDGLLKQIYSSLVLDSVTHRVVTLEVFNQKDLKVSASAMESLIQ
jgi:sugar phosphate isomerase/epimerase